MGTRARDTWLLYVCNRINVVFRLFVSILHCEEPTVSLFPNFVSRSSLVGPSVVNFCLCGNVLLVDIDGKAFASEPCP